MKCWNCQSPLEEALVCERCGMPQPVTGLSPFEILHLAPRLRWREGEIERAYERLALRCHPDLFRAHRDERVLSAGRSAMRALNDALREVRDPLARLKYVLASTGQHEQATRTVPAGLQDSLQVIEKVLVRIDEAREKGDHAAWESEQDHLGALRVKIDAACERSDEDMRQLVDQWDAAVGAASDEWPAMPEDWGARALVWSGERDFLEAMRTRFDDARTWPEEREARTPAR